MCEESYSVVIPMYKSEKTIVPVVDEVTRTLRGCGVSNYEIILVNDCSPDSVLNVSIKLAKKDQHITVLDLAKNVGQERAAIAGYSYSKGDCIISIDDDLQHPAYEIGNLIRALHERDDDIVFASYIDEEGERPWFRSLGTRLNWKMAEILAGKPKGLETNSFLIMRRHVKDAILEYCGKDIYTYGVMFAATSHMSNLPVKHRKRAVGASGNTLPKLIRLWISGAISFSLKIIRGLWVFCIAAVLLAAISAQFGGFIMAVILLLVAIMVVLCIIGEYVGRLYYINEKIPKFTVRKVYHYSHSA